jgi:hypothetical protein
MFTLSKEYGVVRFPTEPSHLKPIQILFAEEETEFPKAAPGNVKVREVAVA